MVMPYHLHMPSYFLETFTEYPCVTCGGKAFYLVSLLFFIQPCIDLCLDFFLCVGVKAADTGGMAAAG